MTILDDLHICWQNFPTNLSHFIPPANIHALPLTLTFVGIYDQGVYFDCYVIRLEIYQGSILPCLNDTLNYHFISDIVKSKTYKYDALQ